MRRMAWMVAFAVTVGLWAESGLGQAGAAVQVDAAVQAQVDAIVAAHHGKVAMYAVQLNTGKTAAVDPDAVVKTASDIKLAMLYEAMVEIREGKASWGETIVLKPGEAVGGSGMLHFFDTPLTLTLKDVLTMMVIVSDNTATNLAIDRFGTDAVNQRMRQLGFVNTWLYKKIMKPAVGPLPADQPKFGLGKTTPREIAGLMEDIGRCRLAKGVDAEGRATFASGPDAQDLAVCKVALEMLRSQFYRETIPRYLDLVDTTESGSAIASKTGSLDAVRNDVAIVEAKTGPIVLAIFTYDNQDHGWTVDNEGEMTIAKLGRAVVTAWSPRGLDAGRLVPGLGLGPGNSWPAEPEGKRAR
jgi:beta-lactamase class A